MTRPRFVHVTEVGARDGLQNEATVLPPAERALLVERLAAVGLPAVEAGAFVSPRRVPQMAGSDLVLRAIRRRPGTAYPVLVPNMQGLEAALAAGADGIALFAAASESFSQKNIGCSIRDSLERFRPVAAQAQALGLPMRGYLSCALDCPFEGPVAPDAVARLARALADLGCDELALSDTIGKGTPDRVRRMVERVALDLPVERLALHLHDTYGQALANVLACLELGIGRFDAAVAGLGGCPFAPGAGGNLATEDLVFMLHGLGIETGVDLEALAVTGGWISARLGRENAARAGRALLAGRSGAA